MVERSLGATLPDVAPRGRDRTSRGQPVLRRGAHRHPDRPRACSSARTAAGRSASCRRASRCPTRFRPSSRRASTCSPPAEKAALQAAVGDRTRLLGRAPSTSWSESRSPIYALLEERDFIRRRPGSSIAGEREYVIKHALTREVAYASLPKARRARLHAQFATGSSVPARAARRACADARPPLRRGRAPEEADLAWAGAEDELARASRAGGLLAPARGRARRRPLRDRRKPWRSSNGPPRSSPIRAGRWSSGAGSARRTRSTSTARPSRRR